MFPSWISGCRWLSISNSFSPLTIKASIQRPPSDHRVNRNIFFAGPSLGIIFGRKWSHCIPSITVTKQIRLSTCQFCDIIFHTSSSHFRHWKKKFTLINGDLSLPGHIFISWYEASHAGHPDVWRGRRDITCQATSWERCSFSVPRESLSVRGK